MKVAIVNETLPYPPTAGNRIRTLNLMCRLASRHELSYICRAAETPEETHLAVSYLEARGIRTVIADDAPRRRAGASLYTAAAANCLSARPYAVTSHNSRKLRNTIARMAARGEADLWQFEWLAYADALAGTGARTLVMAHNVESLIWERYYQNESSPLKKRYLKSQWNKFDRYEREMFQRADGVVCVSPQDAELAHQKLSPRRVWVVDNGIDREFFEQAAGKRDPNTVLFLGSLEWRPNLDALRIMLDTIFPQVLKAQPEARLQIVGRRPPLWLRDAVANHPNIELHADVPDVRTYLATAGVMAVPLRVGGGSRLKILEALACGLPVVSSAVGSEGLAVTSGQHLINADISTFAEELLRVMRNHAASLLMAERGRELVYQRYDWHHLAQKLEGVWESLVKPATRPAPVAREYVAPTLG